MQKHFWTQSTAQMKWYPALLLFTAVISIMGCQQPAEPSITETRNEKQANQSAESKNDKDKGKPQKGEENKTTGSQQQHKPGVVTYQGLAIPLTLSRSPQELNKRIIKETQLNTADAGAILNAQGQVVKYIEKEIEYDIAAAFKDNIILDPSHNSIYPGAVLVGSSIDNGSYREITNGSKREAQISFSLQGVKDKEKGGKAGITSGSIIPSLAEYRKLHNEVLSQHISYHASAHSSYEEKEITDEESFNTQFKLGVGFAAAGIKSKIAAGFKFQKGEKRHRHLITFVETFYTVDVDQENVPLMLDIPRDVVGERMPVYVSSVSYGRIAYLTIESAKTWDELKPSVDVVLKKGTTNLVDADINAAIKNLNDRTDITINIIGGSNQAVTDLKEFHKYIVSGGFSSGNPGQIIKYQLRFLDDNAPAHIKYGGSYKTIERTEIPAEGYEISAAIDTIQCSGFQEADITGAISIQPKGRKDLRKVIFQYDGTSPQSKLPVIRGIKAKPRNADGRIIIPKDTSAIELIFDIQGEGAGRQKRRFITKNHIDNTVALISGFPNTKFKSVTLEREGVSSETLLLDIIFKGTPVQQGK